MLGRRWARGWARRHGTGRAQAGAGGALGARVNARVCSRVLGAGRAGRAAGGAWQRAGGGVRGASGAQRTNRRKGRKRVVGARGATGWALLGVPAGAAGCSCTRLGFQPVFFDSVFFLSHHMNSVHCEINFEKKNLNLIKIKSNQIKFDKIFEK